ncbi:1673_t:CDS:2, partial [Gigaspora margarita]
NNNARYVIIDDFLFLRNISEQKFQRYTCIEQWCFVKKINPCNFESEKFLKELYKNCLIIKLESFDLKKKDEEGNLTNQFLLDGGTETISYFDSSSSGNTNTGSDTTNTGSNTTNIGSGNTSTGGNTTTATGSNIDNNFKLALDEIFKNLEMNRTNDDQKDLERLRKVSKNIVSLIQNINK